MQIEIDKFGRVLIPKSVRNHLGIKAGSVLELSQEDHEIHLRLARQKATLKREGHVLVFTGECLENLEDALNEEREARLKRLF